MLSCRDSCASSDQSMQELAGETGQGQSCSNLAETGSAWQWRNRRLRCGLGD